MAHLEIVGKRNVDAAAWLAVLLDAQRKGDSAAAVRARRELLRIGVRVSVGQGGKGCVHAAK